jgi:hypothetical protein
MEGAIRARLHDLTLRARQMLMSATSDLLEGVYGLKQTGQFAPIDQLPALAASDEARETRIRLERLLDDEKKAGLAPHEAVAKLTKEVAFTWLNRVAAFKMLEARKLTQQAVARGADSNGFKLWLTAPGHEDDLARYEAGSLPQDTRGEGPRDTAYRHYLLAQCAEMAGQIRMLFDPDSLPSRLFPRPRAMAELLALVNDANLASAWNEDETIGWIYQYFNEQEKAEVFAGFGKGEKVKAAEIPAATQLFTPRWIVRALVENSLGRLWLQMRPDSRLRAELDYLTPEIDAPPIPARLVREITLLDPACGTMHFGLVAFDLFAAMYREEIERAGEPGWPERPSVNDLSEIPAAILEYNLFGIDIDLRSVQLSALTLYLKARALDRNAKIRAANLACADVLLLNGARLDAFLEEMAFSRPIYERVIRAVWARLRDANQLGSLLRLEEDIRSLVAAERERYRLEGQGRLPFPELRGLFEEEADDETYWGILEDQIVQAFDEFARRQTLVGVDQSYFSGEATKGMRLLEVMLRRYDVVVTNPPYLDSRDANQKLKKSLDTLYPEAKRNLYSAFIVRCLEVAKPDGRVAMITPLTYMSISSFELTRTVVRSKASIEMLAEMGYGTFPGVRVDCALFVLRAEADAARREAGMGVYFRLVHEPDAAGKQRGFTRAVAALRSGQPAPNVYRYRQGNFDAIPGAPWVYWITPGLRRLFQTLPKLGEIAQPRQGLATADNFRFLRYWWEIGTRRVAFGCADAREAQASGKRWFPYMKGGEFRRWWGNQSYVILWANDGEEMKLWAGSLYNNSHWSRILKSTEYYFRRGVTYSYLTSGSFSARLSPGGFIFDVAGSSLFPEDVLLTLAVMNSSFAAYALSLINPTVNFQVGDLARLPVPRQGSDALRALVEQAISLARAESAEDETTYEFALPPSWSEGPAHVAERHDELTSIERAIDEEVYRLYDISPGDRAAIEADLALGGKDAAESEDTYNERDDAQPENGPDQRAEATPDAEAARASLAERWVSYAVGIVLGRFAPGEAGAFGAGGVTSEVGVQLRALVLPEGIGLMESRRGDDLTERVARALEALVGERQVEALLAAATGGRALREWLARDFFKSHLKRYRNRPIYWLLQSPKKTYSVYLFHERVTPDTLHLLRGSRFLGGRIAALKRENAELDARITGTTGSEKRKLEREREAVETALADLVAFDKALAAVTMRTDSQGMIAGWAPELDDGVLINLAPLAALLPSWSTEPKKCWAALEAGEYDWSHTAMRYWPDRVRERCRTNRSYALAHGLAEEMRQTS